MVGDDPGAFERELDPREVQRRGVGKHEPLRERAGLRVPVPYTRDAVIQEPPAGAQQGRHLARVQVDAARAHVLHHADARDRVELLARELAVVHHADGDQVLQVVVRDAAPRDGRLGLGERDPRDVHPVARGGVQREATEAAADVEHALARLERELRADHLELLILRFLEGRGAAREKCAAVGHRRPQEERDRTRAAGRSGGGRPWRRARGCGGGRAGAAPQPEGAAGAAVRTHARPRPAGGPARCGRSAAAASCRASRAARRGRPPPARRRRRPAPSRAARAPAARAPPRRESARGTWGRLRWWTRAARRPTWTP